MKHEEAQSGAKRVGRNQRRRRLLLYRRIGAGLLAALGVALAVYTLGIALCLAALMWGSASVLLLLEALMLWVDLPVSRLLQGVLGIACITNMATGIARTPHSHEEVLAIANASSKLFCRLLEQVLSEMPVKGGEHV